MAMPSEEKIRQFILDQYRLWGEDRLDEMMTLIREMAPQGYTIEYVGGPVLDGASAMADMIATHGGKIATDVGHLIVNGNVPKVPQRFMALTGAFLRNYVNARFLPLQLALDEFRSEGTVTASILLIPDFHVPVGAGVTGIRGLSGTYKDKQRAERSTSKPQFVIDTVSSLLLERLSAGQYTYLFSEDPGRIAQDYGPYVLRLLQENYDMKQSAGSASSD